MTLGYLAKRLSLFAGAFPDLAERRIIQSGGLGLDMGHGRELAALLLSLEERAGDPGPPTVHVLDANAPEEMRRDYYEEATRGDGSE